MCVRVGGKRERGRASGLVPLRQLKVHARLQVALGILRERRGAAKQSKAKKREGGHRRKHRGTGRNPSVPFIVRMRRDRGSECK